MMQHQLDTMTWLFCRRRTGLLSEFCSFFGRGTDSLSLTPRGIGLKRRDLKPKSYELKFLQVCERVELHWKKTRGRRVEPMILHLPQILIRHSLWLHVPLTTVTDEVTLMQFKVWGGGGVGGWAAIADNCTWVAVTLGSQFYTLHCIKEEPLVNLTDTFLVVHVTLIFYTFLFLPRC